VAIVRTGDVAADRGVHRRLADAQGVGGAAAGATSAEPEAVAAHCAASASAARAAASALQSLVDRLGPPQGVVPVLGLGALQRERRGGHLELIEVHTVQRIVRRQLNDQLVGQVRLPDDLQGPQSPLGDRLAHQEEIREQEAVHIGLAEVVLELVVALHEQVAHMVGGASAHRSTEVEHLAVLLDQLVQHLVVGVLQSRKCTLFNMIFILGF